MEGLMAQTSAHGCGDDAGVMTEALVSSICKRNGGYRTPELNEKMYLHFQGFRKIENLESFVNCKALWLENNLLTTVEGLDALSVLDSLYLQHNSIRSLSNLARPLASLRSVNLSHNLLKSLDGIQFLPALEKLLASDNEIESLSPIAALGNLTVLDVCHNRIQDADSTLVAVERCTKLASLMLHGNDVIRAIKNYRKYMIARNGNLKFLDEYPVFDDERRCAVAFSKNGAEGEKQEREAIRAEEAARQAASKRFFDEVVANAVKRRDEAAATQPTSYFLTNEKQEADDDDENIFVPCAISTSKGAVTGAAAGSHRGKSRPSRGGKQRSGAGNRRTVQKPRHIDVNAHVILAEPNAAPSRLPDDVVEQSEGEILALFELDPLVKQALVERVRSSA